jgi:hypothetical protein
MYGTPHAVNENIFTSSAFVAFCVMSFKNGLPTLRSAYKVAEHLIHKSRLYCSKLQSMRA